jgi:hypothetical protein
MALSCRGTAATLAAVVIVALPGCGGSESPESSGLTAPADTRTAAGTEAEREAQRLARKYVRAMREADVTVLCGTVTASERRRPGGLCDMQEVGALRGPTPKVGVPTVTGQTAEVRVLRAESDSLVLGLELEKGGWKVATARFEKLRR